MNNKNNYMPNRFISILGRTAIAVALALPLAATAPYSVGTANAQSGIIHLSSSTNTRTIKVARAIPKTIRTDTSFAEIVVGDPEVAVVNPLTDRSFYVVGTKAGSTGIALYNSNNELVGMLDIQEIGRASCRERV